MRVRFLRHRAFARGLAVAVLVLGALVAGAYAAAPAAASAGDTVIDNFSAGGGSWSACGNSTFAYFEDASIIGGARELELRDAGSCHFGPFPAQMSIDTAQGTASWFGNHTYAPGQVFSYGTEIGTHDVPWSLSPNKGKGTPLHLSLNLSDDILIRMTQVNNPGLTVQLRDANGNAYDANINLVVGDNLVPLSSFAGLTAAAASDIDGISFSGSENSTPADVVSLFAIHPGDSTPPADAPTLDPAPNAAGWNNSDVTVAWNWTDGGSGVDASNCTQSSTSSGEGAITLTATCADLAGNSASDSVTVKVDKTAPVDNPVVTPAPNAAGWNTTDPTVSWNWTDAGSGIDPSSCTQSSTSTGEGVLTLTSTCSDLAGNSASDSVKVKVDETAPTLAPTVSPNPLTLGGSATVSANATDGGSGIASTSCGQVSTSSLGTFTVTCTATDRAGNSASATATYEVSGRATKQAILAEMQSALGSASRHDGDGLREAVAALRDSLSPGLWADDNHPSSKRVFEDEQHAVDQLSELLRDRHSAIPDATVQGWINGLVAEDQALASLAIADATAAGGDARTLAQATKELTMGNAEAAHGRPNAAIEHYGNAWQQAQKTGRSDDGHDGSVRHDR